MKNQTEHKRRKIHFSRILFPLYVWQILLQPCIQTYPVGDIFIQVILLSSHMSLNKPFISGCNKSRIGLTLSSKNWKMGSQSKSMNFICFHTYPCTPRLKKKNYCYKYWAMMDDYLAPSIAILHQMATLISFHVAGHTGLK